MAVYMLSSCNDQNDSTTTSTTDSLSNVTSTTGSAANDMDTSHTMAAVTDPETNEFVTKAASGGMMEVELGNLANEKAKSQQVKDFGAMMVNDHSAANAELKNIAASNNIPVPAEMLPEHKQSVDMLKNKSGDAFDKEYTNMMVKDHKEDVDAFKKASQNLKNDAVKNFAARTVPVLEKHLNAIQSIDKKM